MRVHDEFKLGEFVTMKGYLLITKVYWAKGCTDLQELETWVKGINSDSHLCRASDFRAYISASSYWNGCTGIVARDINSEPLSDSFNAELILENAVIEKLIRFGVIRKRKHRRIEIYPLFFEYLTKTRFLTPKIDE